MENHNCILLLEDAVIITFYFNNSINLLVMCQIIVLFQF